MHHLFRGNAKRFYIRNIEGNNLSYNEVILIIEREFNSVSRQNNDLLSLVPYKVENELANRKLNWKIPITRKFDHLYLEWDLSETLYFKTELKKIDLNFYHPSAKILFQVISRAKQEEATSETKRMTEQILKACATFQRFTPKPQSFQVRVPGGIIFNQEIALDLMCLDRIPVLHVVDTHIHLSSVAFLRGQTIEVGWNAFIQCWAAIYILDTQSVLKLIKEVNLFHRSGRTSPLCPVSSWYRLVLNAITR